MLVVHVRVYVKFFIVWFRTFACQLKRTKIYCQWVSKIFRISTITTLIMTWCPTRIYNDGNSTGFVRPRRARDG